MTLTTAAWLTVLAACGTTAVRALHARPAAARVRVDRRRTNGDAWHPHVTSGCGR